MTEDGPPPDPATDPTDDPPPEQRIGHVLGFRLNANQAILRIQPGTIQVGDRIRIKGPGIDLVETITELIQRPTDGNPNPRPDRVALVIHGRARPNDTVYRLARRPNTETDPT